MIISEIQSEIGHCSYDSAKFKAPADFSHHAILCMTLSLSIFGLNFAIWFSNVTLKIRSRSPKLFEIFAMSMY